MICPDRERHERLCCGSCGVDKTGTHELWLAVALWRAGIAARRCTQGKSALIRSH